MAGTIPNSLQLRSTSSGLLGWGMRLALTRGGTPRSKMAGSAILISDSTRDKGRGNPLALLSAPPPDINDDCVLPHAGGGEIGAAFSRAAKAKDEDARSSKLNSLGPRQSRTNRFPIPNVYMDLLRSDEDSQPTRGDEHGGAVGSESAVDSAEDVVADGSVASHARRFWRASRRAARDRLGTLGPDVEPWQRRVSELHESLWLEEINTSLEMRRLRFTAGSLPKNDDNLFVLDVEHFSDTAAAYLDERGLLRSLRVLLRCPSSNRSFWAAVQPGSSAGTLLLMAPSSLASVTGPLDVEFHQQRFQHESMHRALESSMTFDLLTRSNEHSVMASTNRAMETEVSLPPSLNEGQRRAVLAWLYPADGVDLRKRPLVIWGPPGTGKSTLAAFIVWSVVQRQPSDTRVLVSAPSNTGADVMCAKLAKLGFGKDQMLRLNAIGRSTTTVPEEILTYCALAPDTTRRHSDSRLGPSFIVPPLQELQRFKVIVATCITSEHIARAIRDNGGSNGWFSHVVIDEAGEATEPETLVPLSLLRPTAGASVLLGDHYQLGPLVVSLLASQIGSLDISMIERLAISRFNAVYASTKDGSVELSKNAFEACEEYGLFFLTESFRSHEAIMSLYSRMFYGDQLEHRYRDHQVQLMSFFKARGLDVPVIMHHVEGKERRDPQSSSYFNLEEIFVLREYVDDLLADKKSGLKARDIGVITPYAKQLQMLEKHLSHSVSDSEGLDCGTVEKFQGQERRVVLMTTVRCQQKASGDDGHASTRRPIGFLADPKRLNVAISRASAGLIIVGDLRTLAAHSAHWRYLVQLGRKMGAIRGGDPFSEVSRTSSVQPQMAPPQFVEPAKSEAAWGTLTEE
eukprot:TRINITY_DN30418_c0_g1_i2.p1 TRINITY_DN30418_c0_g1~~TRINITY_DN30418_c0_g1_i2.p1  ORF type:complete len:856 (+),score=131.49 TRINITY_DN30418_c0_g1_i2:75-2642(+)